MNKDKCQCSKSQDLKENTDYSQISTNTPLIENKSPSPHCPYSRIPSPTSPTTPSSHCPYSRIPSPTTPTSPTTPSSHCPYSRIPTSSPHSPYSRIPTPTYKKSNDEAQKVKCECSNKTLNSNILEKPPSTICKYKTENFGIKLCPYKLNLAVQKSIENENNSNIYNGRKQLEVLNKNFRKCTCSKRSFDVKSLPSKFATPENRSEGSIPLLETSYKKITGDVTGLPCNYNPITTTKSDSDVKPTNYQNYDENYKKDVPTLNQADNNQFQKQIFLPEIKVDIEPKCNQTIQIDVKPNFYNSNAKGILTIPLQLRFCKTVNDNNKLTQLEKKPDEPDYDKKNFLKPTLLYKSCDHKINVESYMEDLLEDESKKQTEIEENQVVEQSSSTEKVKQTKVEIIKMEEVTCVNCEYSASTDNVQVQTDLMLGGKLLSESLNSVPEDLVPVKIEPKSRSEEDYLPWNELLLPPTDKIRITPMKKKFSKKVICQAEENPSPIHPPTPPSTPRSPTPPSKKSSKLSSCCAGIPDDDIIQAVNENLHKIQAITKELPPLPKKIPFVFNDCPVSSEPYLKSLFNYFPPKEVSVSPCSSKPKIHWKTLILPENIAIRKLEKIKPDQLPIISISSPCICKKRTSNVERKDEKSSNIKSCPHLIKSIKTYSDISIDSTDKSKKVSIIVNKSLTCNQTKITINEETMSKEITPDPSVTCKYLNQNVLKSSETSQPTSSEISTKCACKKSSKQINATQNEAKSEKSTIDAYKQDPVVLAFQACEAELKPVKEALLEVQQKLKNLNMPELDCIFNKQDKMVENLPSSSSMMNRSNCACHHIYKAKTQDFTTSNSYQPILFPPQMLQYPVSVPQFQQFSHPVSNFASMQSYHIKNTAYSNYSTEKRQDSSNKTVKRNKGTQKTGRYKKEKCTYKCSTDSSNTSSRCSSNSSYACSSLKSDDYFTPCCSGTHKEQSRCERSKEKRIKSMMAFAKNTDSQCPFLDAMRSMIMKKKACKYNESENCLSYETDFLTNCMKKMKLRFKIHQKQNK